MATSRAEARGSRANSSSRRSRLVPFTSFMLKKWLPAALADLVDRHDVRMIELGNGFRLVLKSNQLGFRCEAARLDNLEGDGSVERSLVGFQDHAHPATPQLAQNFVAGCI